MLASLGYDVWLGSNRGSGYPDYSNHIAYHPIEDAKYFYNYTIADMAGSDLPTLIDYILGETYMQQLTYIGLDRGATMMFYGIIKNPDYFT